MTRAAPSAWRSPALSSCACAQHCRVAPHRELHRGRADAARRTRHQHRLAGRDAGPVDHVFRCRIRAGKRRQFRVGPRAVDGVRLDRRHRHEFGKRAVAVCAEIRGRLQRSVRGPQHRVDEHALADARRGHTLADGHDAAAGVGALDPRESKGRPAPPAVAGCCASDGDRRRGRAGDRLGIPADPRVHVRVVDAGRVHAHQHFAASGNRHRDILAVFQLLDAAVAEQPDGAHDARYHRARGHVGAQSQPSRR